MLHSRGQRRPALRAGVQIPDQVRTLASCFMHLRKISLMEDQVDAQRYYGETSKSGVAIVN